MPMKDMGDNLTTGTKDLISKSDNFTLHYFLEYRVAELTTTIYPILLLILGLSGNCLSILVLLKSNNRKTSTSLLLISLAGTDSLILLSSVLLKWLEDVFEIKFTSYSSIFCKLHTFSTYLTLQLSAWILVLITLERVYCVRYPVKVRTVVTRRRVAFALLLLLLSLSILNGHILYGLHVEYDNILLVDKCTVVFEHEHFMFRIWPLIDFLFAFSIPCCVFVVCNTIIFVTVKTSQTFRRRSYVQSTYSSRSECERNRTSQYYTVTALTLNIAFVVLVSPSVIFGIGQPYWFPLEDRTAQRHAQLILIGVIVHMLMFTNNAINFMLYVLCGRKFRHDVLSLCRHSAAETALHVNQFDFHRDNM